MLREKGVSEEEIRELFEVQKPLSRLQVTKDYRIVLQDYGGREVKMEPIHRAVYCLFLMHLKESASRNCQTTVRNWLLSTVP